MFKDESEDVPVTWKHWLMAGKLGLSAVMRYGKAQPGDRSMVIYFYSKLLTNLSFTFFIKFFRSTLFIRRGIALQNT